MKKQYQFGHAIIEIHLSEGIPIPENMQKFECVCENIDRVYQIENATSIAEVEHMFRANYPKAREIKREAIRVLTSGDIECRILYFVGSAKPYGISIEEEGKTRVWVEQMTMPLLQYDTIFVSLLALEKLMLEKDCLILHSAYMCRKGKAVLFSAPSETGKSTQANLWKKYRGTRTINGDRSLLIREADGWYAYGWPVCGSSEICCNETYQIQAIVMLHQDKINSVEKLNGFPAVQRLMPEITINMWNVEFQMKALDLIEKIVSEVPIYELGCDISEEAVKCLESVL